MVDMDDHIEIRNEENEILFNEPEVIIFETKMLLKKNGELNRDTIKKKCNINNKVIYKLNMFVL